MTTIIIDRLKGTVYTDSRGTETFKHTAISLKGIKHTYYDQIDDEVNKIAFYKNNHLMTGCGSLILLREMEKFIINSNFLIGKKGFFIKSPHSLSDTNIYVCKSTLGKNYVVKYCLTAHKIIFNHQWVSVKRSVMKDTHRFIVDGSGKRWAEGSLFEQDNAYKAMDAAKHYDKYSGGITKIGVFGVKEVVV